MKYARIYVTTIAAILVLSAFLGAMPGVLATGNGAPSGKHWNLNIIGVDKDKNDVPKWDSGNRIFVKLWGKTTIWLVPGPEFDVMDADGTDGSATLQLLDPFLYDIAVSNETQYSIYVRALGKPGGKSNMTAGFVDELGNYWYSVVNVTLTRTKGQSKFSDKTVELTTITLANGTRLRLFDNEYYQYFWDYDNYGLKLVQMRIYMIPQVV